MNHSTIPSNTKEIPITAHIFEGYLYIKQDDKWLWRLFRFDGSTLTCLSSKKNKLPPHTLLDQLAMSMTDNHRPISFLTSCSNSFTSPMLATPKNKSLRLSCDTFDDFHIKDEEPAIASYYQLPKWTIDMINISSISILKSRSNSKSYTNPFSSLNKSSKSFSIRTFDGGCYVMRAQKQHDLERWIFVLAKMWKVSQAARQLYQPPHTVSPNPYYQQQQQQQQQHHNGAPMMLGPSVNHQNEPDSRLLNPNIDHSLPLSTEKVLWIEEWIKSLAELDACGESNVDLDYISAYESMDQSGTSSSGQSNNGRSRNSSGSQNSLHKKSISQRELPDISEFNSNLFQDVNTICTDEASLRKYTYQSLRYHTSTRSHRVKLVGHNTTDICMEPPVHFTSDDFCLSPLEDIKSSTDSQQLNDENVCLADVQKYLKNMDINSKQKERYSIQPRSTSSMKLKSPHKEWHRNSWAPDISTLT